MNEAETRAELIDPALKAAGWGEVEGSRIRREYPITLGRLQGSGKRAAPLSADYVLIYRNRRLAVVEAKRRSLPVTEGLAQAKEYAGLLQVRFTYSTNGKGLYQVDMKTGKEGGLDDLPAFPTPDELWAKTFPTRDDWRDRFAGVPFEDRGGTWDARYYQDNAIENALDAIARGKDRILLTLATGTGKTAIAFQIAWKLFHSRWNLSREPGRRPRILFLADRNILADQAYNAFSAFPEDALARITPDEIRRKGRPPKNASIFFTIFQTFMSGPDETPYFGEYPPEFFDFIVIDECHRGGANDESTWRAILEYFDPAVQLGLTATPKRKGNVDTYSYFGRPVYEYSLRAGINDGFLTPFKVRQFATSLDDYVYDGADEVIQGEVEEGDAFGEDKFNVAGGIQIPERERYRVRTFMDEMVQSEKTLVFCHGQPHAAMICDIVNQEKESADPNYCVRVTANDGKRGEEFLRQFQDNDKTVPTVLTTSTKLSTGVDARNVRNIVLLRPVRSMIEFKQIIGRGTRLFDGKDYFTIYDFVKAYEHFEDPEWDGEPLEPEEPKPRRGGVGDHPQTPLPDPDEPEPEDKQVIIRLADGKERRIRHVAATTYWGPDGRPMSAVEFVEHLFGVTPDLFRSEDELRELWSKPDTRKALLAALEERGWDGERLAEIRRLIDAEKSDLYDVLAYVAYATDPITRLERVDRHRDGIFNDYDGKLGAFLDFVLDQYVKEGVGELDQDNLPGLIKVRYGTTHDAVRELGGIPEIRDAFVEFQRHLYES